MASGSIFVMKCSCFTFVVTDECRKCEEELKLVKSWTSTPGHYKLCTRYRHYDIINIYRFYMLFYNSALFPSFILKQVRDGDYS